SLHLRQQHRAHAFLERRVAPEARECLVEHRLLLMARDEERGKGRVPVGALAQSRGGEHAHRVDHLVGADGDAGGPEDTGEMEDVGGELAAHAATRDFASSSSAPRSSPCSRAMSSWYLRSAPSVSPMVCGSSDT